MMDLDTENRLATMLLEEARRLRAEAEKEGVHAYLRKPTTRVRPNSRFLTATVLGVQQANKSVEVNELWRAREKELELVSRSKDKGRNRSKAYDHDASQRGREKNRATSTSYPSSSRHANEYYDSSEEDGLRDDDVEKFLHSRNKRGRGSVGSRMDEPGPFPACRSSDEGTDMRIQEEWERQILNPSKPLALSFDDDSSARDITERQGVKKDDSSSSKKRHGDKRHRSKEEKSRKKRRKEKRSKHRHESL